MELGFHFEISDIIEYKDEECEKKEEEKEKGKVKPASPTHWPHESEDNSHERYNQNLKRVKKKQKTLP